MKRKVIQLAGKTFVVSLPSKWVKKHGVKKGDDIEVEERDRNLVIGTERTGAAEKKEIDADQLGVLTKRCIFRQYQEGVDEIQVNFKNPEEIRKIQDYITELIGYEIIKQGNKHAVISDISGQANHEFSQLTRRLFLLLKGIIEDSYQAFCEKDMESLRNIVYRDAEINKFTHFCIRSLSKQNMQESKKQAYFCIIYTLERIGDDFKGLIELIANSKKIPDKETIALYAGAKDLFTKIYEFSFDNKLETAKEIAKIHANVRKKANDYLLDKKCDIQTAVFLRAIINSLITIQELQLPYMII